MEEYIEQAYLKILREELVPAMGCTEPIAVAYAAALARRALGAEPESMTVRASANIIKNVKSVVVPNTGGLRGLAAAAVAGAVAGRSEARLQVLARVTPEQEKEIARRVETLPCRVLPSDKPYVFHVEVELAGGGHTARAELAGHHTNVIALERVGELLSHLD